MGSNPPDGNRNSAHLIRAIAEQEARLAQLRADQHRTEETLVRLQAELAEIDRVSVPKRRPSTIRAARTDYAAGPISPNDKIALSLQHGPRQAGNSVFLDEQFQPHDDQWAFLAAVRRLPPDDVLRIAAEASRTGRVIGVRFVPPEDETDREPWKRPPSSFGPRAAPARPSSGRADRPGAWRRRHFLLVMATGTGKTRTAMGLIDVLLRAHWARRVLFLVDRIALRDQAVDAFREHLPSSPYWPRTEGHRVETAWAANRRLDQLDAALAEGLVA